ncbi:MAG TPA: phosphoglucosamine mutase [Firmicutes bacterium]|nr:phosphoglucosamine mutase [Bacillota bacterium]
MARLFGTDGVRGVANKELTPELALQLGRAGAVVLAEKARRRPKVLIGKDTRISGDMLEAALIAGTTSTGADVYLLGVVPTPAVAYLTKLLKADAGIMISASHNPVEDNGIKFFADTGFKLSDQTEDQIEELINTGVDLRPVGAELGRVYRQGNALELYVDFLLSTVDFGLQGFHIAVDCANGAASQAAPAVLTKLGARVSVINHQPNGTNINVNCGSTHIEVLQEYVNQVKADFGFSYDGDADRVLAVDEQGSVVDGDQILAVCGLHLLAQGRLPEKAIAATVYSNGGLAQAMEQAGGHVVTTAAGDRYVLEAMLEHGLALGGEQSGHVIFLEHGTTGDGILTTLQLLSVVQQSGKKLSELAQVMPIYPQMLENVRVTTKDGWDRNLRICQAIEGAKAKLGINGRIFVRASGTEPVIRVMGEHPDPDLLAEAVAGVVAVIKAEQGA